MYSVNEKPMAFIEKRPCPLGVVHNAEERLGIPPPKVTADSHHRDTAGDARQEPYGAVTPSGDILNRITLLSAAVPSGPCP